MFFTYNQNNSGGWFDEQVGHYVIIEADNAEQADERAQGVGVYFNSEQDCECCGSRWYPAYEGSPTPQVYGRSPEDHCRKGGWPFPSIVVHYADGTVKRYETPKEK